MLDVGKLAPDFELRSISGEMIKLSNFLGKKVLLCFIKDAIHESNDMNSYALLDWAYHEFVKMGIIPICICPKNEKEVPSFYQKVLVLTPMLLDEYGDTTQLYEVEIERVTFGQPYRIVQECAFLIDEEGYIEKLFKKFHYQFGMKYVLAYLRKQGKAKVSRKNRL